MTRSEKAERKIRKLVDENIELTNYIRNIEVEYDVLTDQYMNGDITAPIGRQQRYLERLSSRHKRRIERNCNKIFKLRQGVAK